MNRLGFSLLSLGVTLAFVGWFYEHHIVTGFGVIPLIVLTGLAAVVPSTIAPDHARATQPRDRLDTLLLTAGLASAFAITVVGWLHFTAGGNGLVVALAGFGLGLAMTAFNSLEESTAREWVSRYTPRGKRSRAPRQNQVRSEAPRETETNDDGIVVVGEAPGSGSR